MLKLNAAIDEYAAGKKWYWYLIPLGFTGFFLYQVTKFVAGEQPPLVVMPLQMLDFGIHEAGHLIFILFPLIVVAAAGVGLEVLFPLLVCFAAWRHKSYFLAAMSLSWVALACSSGGQYMADARMQVLPLVSMGGPDNSVHDWNFVFGELGLLEHDMVIGGAFRSFGLILGIAGLLIGMYLMVRMARAQDDRTKWDGLDDTGKAARSYARPNAKTPPPVNVTGKPVPTSQLYPVATEGRLAEVMSAEDMAKRQAEKRN